jgi:hypothetical protein
MTSPHRQETGRLSLDLLRRYESDGVEMCEANPRVNNARNTGEQMLAKWSAPLKCGSGLNGHNEDTCLAYDRK